MKILLASVITYLFVSFVAWSGSEGEMGWTALLAPLALLLPFAVIIGLVALWQWAAA